MESKICGIKDSFTLNYIINHNFPPQYIGFICNYKNSKRFISFDKLKNLLKEFLVWSYINVLDVGEIIDVNTEREILVNLALTRFWKKSFRIEMDFT